MEEGHFTEIANSICFIKINTDLLEFAGKPLCKFFHSIEGLRQWDSTSMIRMNISYVQAYPVHVKKIELDLSG